MSRPPGLMRVKGRRDGGHVSLGLRQQGPELSTGFGLGPESPSPGTHLHNLCRYFAYQGPSKASLLGSETLRPALVGHTGPEGQKQNPRGRGGGGGVVEIKSHE